MAVSPVDLLNPKAYSRDRDMKLERWRICRDCEQLGAASRCQLCGCFMKMKVQLKEASCPAGKWAAETDAS